MDSGKKVLKKKSSVNMRQAPEGNSIKQRKPMKHKLTPNTPDSQKKPKKKTPKKKQKPDLSDDEWDVDETMTTSVSRSVASPESSDMEIDVDESIAPQIARKKSKLSGGGGKKNKRVEEEDGGMETDESWEAAVEKARGMPDGAMDDDDEEHDGENGEEDKPAPSKNFEKGKKKPLNIIATAAKKLKLISSGGKSTDSAGIKRKRDTSKEEEESVKPEHMKFRDRKSMRQSQDNANYDLAQRAKSLWNELRRMDLKNEKRIQLSNELFAMVKGRTKTLIFAHDTSRVIQCLLKYGTQEHKNAVFEELKGVIVDLCKSKYAKFFVRKLLKYGTKNQKNHVFTSLYGNVRKLIKHKEACEIVEVAYNDYANAQQRSALVEEFYGPSFALFKTGDVRTLDQIMTSQPEKRETILSNMRDALAVLAEKAVLQYSIVHRIFWEYFTFAPAKLRTDMIEAVREGLIHMLHTRDGARVAMFCLWHGTAKDRKIIIKSMKSYVVKICKEEYGHMVLLSLFDVLDDTKLVQKVILDNWKQQNLYLVETAQCEGMVEVEAARYEQTLPTPSPSIRPVKTAGTQRVNMEMMKSVSDVAADQYGRKVLLYLLAPRDPRHFHPDIIKVLQPGDGNATSKKDTATRQTELLEFVSKPLVNLIAQNAKTLATNNASLILVLTIITKVKSDPTEAMRALALLAAEPFSSGQQHIVEQTAGHLTLKRLIINDAERIKQGEKVLFSSILMDLVPDGALKSWAACNRGCFTLCFLLDLNHDDISAAVKKALQGVSPSLQKMDFKGAQLLLTKLKA